MLRRIRIRNFKSLRDVEFVPGCNNVFIGPNGSGKSNIIDALKFLTSIALGGLVPAVNSRGGFAEALWKGEPAAQSLALDLDLQFGAQGFRYEFEVESVGVGGMFVRREVLTALEGGRRLLSTQAGQGKALHMDGTHAFQTSSPVSLALLESNVPGWFGTSIRNAIAGWRFYDLIPRHMEGSRQMVAAPFLTETGDNLVQFLLTLKAQYSNEFRELEQAARDCFPSLSEIIPWPTQHGQVTLTARERGLRTPVQAASLPHGELVFLALLALICAPPEMGSPVNCIEEPESHLHPSLIQQIVPMLLARQREFEGRAEAMPTQLFATTHSPYVVDAFPADALWLVAKDENGETRLEKPAQDQSLKALLEQGGLGDLAFSGALAAK